MIKALSSHKILFLSLGVVIVAYFFLCYILFASHPSDDPWPEERVSYRIEEIRGPLEFLWSREGVFILHKWTSFPPAMAASQGKVFAVGMLDQPDGYLEMLAFQSQDGSLAWRSDKFIPDAGVVAIPDALYAGANGFGTMISYELNTGQILWSERMPSARSILGFTVIDNVIYVISSAGTHLLQADTGKIQKTFTEAVSMETLQEALVQLVDPQTAQVKPEYFEDNIFMPSDLRFEDGEAIDRKTGERLWKIEGGTLSNVVTTSSAVYVLTFDRKLLVLNPQSGSVIASVQFDPREETLDTTSSFAHSFYVAVDEVMGIVYVFLGDSTELFAFKLVR